MPPIAAPKIVEIEARLLAGMRITTSLSENRTVELWRSFKSRLKELEYKKEAGFYSMQIYSELLSMQAFTPTTIFEKWAAAELDSLVTLPEGFQSYTLSGGLYAVFIHKGPASTFHQTARYIYGQWMPSSDYQLDHRPHFEIVTGKYLPNDPNSEEEVWIPIKKR